MTIIQFNPIQQQNNTKPKNGIQYYSDHAGMQTMPEDEFRLSKANRKSKNPISENEILKKGNALYESALKKKHYLEKKIFKAICNDYQYFKDEKGKPVTFEIDNLGRHVMVECDEKGNDERRTTFSPQDGRIWSIKTGENEKIIFFNYQDHYTEIRKTTEPSLFKKGIKEVYCYSDHNLCGYNRYEQGLFSKETLVDRITFN